MPWNRPFQPSIGSAIQMVTRSPAGGWVTITVTRQDAGIVPLPASTAADSIVVSGSVTPVRLSQVRTGFAFATSGFGTIGGGAVACVDGCPWAAATRPNGA